MLMSRTVIQYGRVIYGYQWDRGPTTIRVMNAQQVAGSGAACLLDRVTLQRQLEIGTRTTDNSPRSVSHQV